MRARESESVIGWIAVLGYAAVCAILLSLY